MISRGGHQKKEWQRKKCFAPKKNKLRQQFEGRRNKKREFGKAIVTIKDKGERSNSASKETMIMHGNETYKGQKVSLILNSYTSSLMILFRFSFTTTGY